VETIDQIFNNKDKIRLTKEEYNNLIRKQGNFLRNTQKIESKSASPIVSRSNSTQGSAKHKKEAKLGKIMAKEVSPM